MRYLSSKILRGALLAAAALATLLRYAAVWDSPQIDLVGYWQVATALLHGELPFSGASEWIVAAPTLLPVYGPFALLPLDSARHLFLCGNVLCALALAALLARSVLDALGKPPAWDLAAAISLWLLNSSPVMEDLRNGQCSLLIALGLQLALGGSLAWRGVGLALAMALKPTFGLFGVEVLATRRWGVCAIAVAAFALAALLPALFGCNLRETYAAFFHAIALSRQKNGVNTAWTNGCDMISLDFLSGPPLRHAVQGLLALSALGAMAADFKTRKPPRFDTLFLVATVSLCVVYHRLYDASVALPFLALATLSAIRERRPGRAATGALLCAYYLWPIGQVLRASEWLGGHAPSMPSIIAISPWMGHGFEHLFPLGGCATLLLALYAAELRFCRGSLSATPER